MELSKEYKSTINDLLVLESKIHEDERGYFLENWRKVDLIDNGVPESFFNDKLQNNVSVSKKGTIRSMHCQGWAKLMTVAYGTFRMCFVDLRKNSTSYKNVFMLEVKPGMAIYVPAGVSNGVQALTDNGILNYIVTDYFNKDEKYLGIMPLDEDLNLPWDKTIDYIISDKDKSNLSYKEILGK